jgi:hypothetical protein
VLGELVYQLKYRNGPLDDIVDTAGAFVTERWNGVIDCIVPPPPSLHRTKQPALLIASGVAAILGVPSLAAAAVKATATPQMKNVPFTSAARFFPRPSRRAPFTTTREPTDDPITQRTEVRLWLDQELLIRIVRTADHEAACRRHGPCTLLHQVAPIIRVCQVEQDVPSRLSTRDHSHCRRPPSSANASCHERNRAVEPLVHAIANYLCAPGTGAEDFVERLRMRRIWGWALLNQHVQLTPHHVNEQLHAAGSHEVAKQSRRNLETVRVNKEERECHLSTVAAEVVEDGGQTLECITLAGLHVHPSREWFELSELRFERRKIRGISLDEQEIELGGVQQLLAVGGAQQSL